MSPEKSALTRTAELNRTFFMVVPRKSAPVSFELPKSTLVRSSPVNTNPSSFAAPKETLWTFAPVNFTPVKLLPVTLLKQVFEMFAFVKSTPLMVAEWNVVQSHR